MGRPFVCVLFFLALSAPLSVLAQAPDGIGIRAQGMGGAFTAVADDATATWWNPAGLASGSYFNAIVEYGQLTDSDLDHVGFSFAFPALGLSYYRMTVSEIQTPSSTAAPPGGRQDPGTLNVRTSELSQFGATVGQSVGGHLILASTLKWLKAVDDSEAGLDIGAMMQFRVGRLGVIVRNVREPDFGEDGPTPLELQRQVRVGGALYGPARGGRLVLSVDGDILRVMTLLGEERRIAGGGEFWVGNRFIGLRAGVSGSTIGESRVAASGGVSVAVHRGIYFDGQLTGGSDRTRKGWGTAFRVTF